MGTINPPFAASGSRSPTKRPRQIPQSVKAACLKMIHEGCDIVVAAQASGLRPDTMRRWLHRPELVGFLRRERAAFRQAICASNEAVLADIRDTAANSMSRVAAIKTLEQLDEETSARRAGDTPSPGIVIRVLTVLPPAVPVDVTPSEAPRIIDAGEQ